ncbi:MULTISPECIES: NF038130 family PEP-CTERM protein [Kamptonema]|uniref:NF038130 family PEP-CTERM protein n=1 Tax=Kamptonema TaxID=1501433 RepID=UPI0001DAC148|nr:MULTISPECIES: NF038130 family PEP-CTERM protein [Kamptonema]CBN56638.1 exported hypothetical protein [Kamptonema sp. PCC 6506]
MAYLVKQFLISASVLVGLGAIAPASSLAASITGATIGGTAAYLTYSSNGTNTFTVANTQANVQAALDGDSSSPGGNVELFSNSEQSPISPANISQSFNALYNFLDYNQYTSLSGQIGGQDTVLLPINYYSILFYLPVAFSVLATQIFLMSIKMAGQLKLV